MGSLSYQNVSFYLQKPLNNNEVYENKMKRIVT